MEKTIGITGAAIPLQAEVSLTDKAGLGGNSQKVTLGGASAQSTAIAAVTVVVTPDTNCFFREGSNPTALATGVDHILIAFNSYRIPITSGNKLAFIPVSGSSGAVYITPNA
jgi:hypothetical protein